MPTLIDLKCTYCQIDFQRDLRGYNNQMKDNPNTVWFCGAHCRSMHGREDRNCLLCEKSFNVIKTWKQKFCSQNCFAHHNNDERKNLKPILKNCPKCSSPFLTNPTTASHKKCFTCAEQVKKEKNEKQAKKLKSQPKPPKPLNHRKKSPNKIRLCECGADLTNSKRDKCKTCKPIIRIAQKRSKNEISFADKCTEKWNCSYNECLFNGWDADVIIKDLKIAVLWNGIWHYSTVNFKDKPTSLLQIQTRDKLKMKQIIAAGWTPYIIKDLKNANEKKVQNEFELFLTYLWQAWFRQACLDFAQKDLHGDFHEWVKNNISNT